MTYPMMWLWGAVMSGIVTSEVFHFASSVWCVMLIGILATLGWSLKKQWGVALVTMVGCVVLGGWSAARVGEQREYAKRTACFTESTFPFAPAWRIRIDAPITRMTLGQKALSQRTMATLLAVQDGDGDWRAVQSGRVQVHLKDGAPVARGDVVQVRLKVSPWEAPHNPTDTDMGLWIRQHGLTARASVASAHVVVQRGAGWTAAMDRWRHGAEQHMEQHVSAAVLGLAKALALGDYGDISDQRRQAWADAGAAHLLSVSGLHVGMLAALVYGLLTRVIGTLCPAAGARFSLRRMVAWCTIPLLVLYCLCTGGSPATVRSTWMACTYFIAIGLGCGSSAVNALGLAGVLMLLQAPLTIYDAGFLLSFVAVGALLVWPSAPKVNDDSEQNASAGTYPSWMTKTCATMQRAWTWLRTMLVLSVLATAATAPITAFYFNNVSLAAPIVNLIAVPVGTFLATPLALGYVVCAPILQKLHGMAWVAKPLEWVLWALDAMVTHAAGWPWAKVRVPTPTWWELVLYSAACLGVLALVRASVMSSPFARPLSLSAVFASLYRQRVACASVILGIAGCFGCWAMRAWQQRPDGSLSIMFAYVGQGDGALMQLPQGGTVLIDGGGVVGDGDAWEPGEKVITPLLRAHGVTVIDLVVLTHPHPDHYGGLLHVSEHFPIKALWWTGEAEEMPAQQRLKAAVERGGGRVYRAAELPAVTMLEGVRFELWHPRPYAPGSPFNATYDSDGMPYYPGLSTNDNSITLRVLYGQRSLMLTGDIERDTEAILGPMLTEAGVMGVDILKVPHHGSKTSSTWPLLQALHPALAVISCGVNNVFHFPHPSVLARYRENNTQVWRTDTAGMITARTDGHVWRVDGYRGGALQIH